VPLAARRRAIKAPLVPAAILAAILALACLPCAARAAGPDDKASDPKFAARALAEHANALYEAGKYQEAIDLFVEADKLYHAPTLLLALGRAYAAAGKLVEARDVFRRVAGEQLPPGASIPFQDAQKAAKDELAAVDKRVPTLQIAVRGGRGGGLTIKVDDAPLADWAPDRAVPLNPGAHSVTVVPVGDVGVGRSVTLAEGAHERVEIELPVPAPVAPRVTEPPPPSPPPPPPRRGFIVPAFGAFTIGAVGLAVGIGAGVAAANDAATIRGLCKGSVCLPTNPSTPQARSDLSSAKGLATASTVGFVFAAVGVAAGVALVFVPAGPSAPQRAAIAIGPGSIALTGEL
jgi:hypothetical protein